jgi:UDP-N-acetylglucosamine acyltransferase
MQIDSTAQVSPTALLGRNVRIGAFCVVHENVEIGDGSVIHTHAEIGGGGGRVMIGANCEIGKSACIGGRVTIGNGSRIGAFSLVKGIAVIGRETAIFNHCSIGTTAQHPAFGPPNGSVAIGNGTTIREFCTVQLATEAAATTVGDGCYLMSGCRINHDCVLGRDVKMADGVILGGTVTVGDHSYLGMGCMVHQRLRIGSFTMIGMNATIVRHVPPYATVIDRRFARINRVGMQMRGATPADVAAVEAYFYSRETSNPTASPWLARIAEFEADCAGQKILLPPIDAA